MEKAQKAVGKEEFWICDSDRCRYRVLTQDVNGKSFKKAPARCPSCGKKPDPPKTAQPATRDPR